ncbi:MAG: hypothetical protein ACW98X_23100 [Promethearchaeota archaeon]|jgi:hypothetical protein
MCIIAVDYDGTITADFNKARAALKKLKDAGHTIVIWSSRNNPHQHGLGQPGVYAEIYDDVDRGDIGKFHAQVYIDDKAWRFENNWDEIVSRIY